jgi:hypothetical protein
VTPKEVALAKTLVNALAESFDPAKYRDTYRERLEALIAAKVEGRQTAVVTTTPHAKPVADIMEALRKSLEAVKKPAAKAEASARRTSKRSARWLTHGSMMRIAIVSNIRANRTAFEAILRDLRQTSPDLILHRGDLPRWMEVLRKLAIGFAPESRTEFASR